MTPSESLNHRTETNSEKLSILKRIRTGFQSWWKRHVIREMTQRESDYLDLICFIEKNYLTAEEERTLIDNHKQKYNC